MPKATLKGLAKKKGRPAGKAGEGSSKDPSYIPEDDSSSGSEAGRLRERIREAGGRRLAEAAVTEGAQGDDRDENEGDDENENEGAG